MIPESRTNMNCASKFEISENPTFVNVNLAVPVFEISECVDESEIEGITIDDITVSPPDRAKRALERFEVGCVSVVVPSIDNNPDDTVNNDFDADTSLIVFVPVNVNEPPLTFPIEIGNGDTIGYVRNPMLVGVITASRSGAVTNMALPFRAEQVEKVVPDPITNDPAVIEIDNAPPFPADEQFVNVQPVSVSVSWAEGSVDSIPAPDPVVFSIFEISTEVSVTIPPVWDIKLDDERIRGFEVANFRSVDVIARLPDEIEKSDDRCDTAPLGFTIETPAFNVRVDPQIEKRDFDSFVGNSIETSEIVRGPFFTSNSPEVPNRIVFLSDADDERLHPSVREVI
ncbi:hypothetical protein BLNAU_2968 [Blattamonas nauphoetae]|uniref:Uncharacterized protein n=1 Tax=Blattamonas nauphoetae TaxID=2049346 RepID=A0ABQ9YDV2_9EUKA|nr:hypothetical protein BLNAU_2968 [Blattamonas nauphoetae]